MGGEADQHDGDRRQYRRLHVPVFCRAAGMEVMSRRHPIDLSFGGIRIYSEEPFKKGERLTLELMAQGAPATTFTAEVVWIEHLPAGSPARYDIGLRFQGVDPEQAKVLERMLAKPV